MKDKFIYFLNIFRKIVCDKLFYQWKIYYVK